MKKKSRESGVNVALTVTLVFFVCLLSFSVGVVSGSRFSDREYQVKMIEENTQYAKQGLNDEENSPLSEDMTEKEVELLTKKALEEANKSPDVEINETDEIIAEIEQLNEMEKAAKGEDASNVASPDKVAAKADKKAEPDRAAASVPQKKPTTPKPKAIEYTVQVASYATMQEAEDHSKKLIDKGFPAFPVQADVDGKVWFRVSIGSFKSRKAAIDYQQDLKKQAVVKSSFVQKILRK